MTKIQTERGVQILEELLRWCVRKNKHPKRLQFRIARIAIMCAMTESNLQVYANSNIPESMKLPHDAVGSDHASVGLFQQQVPMWGTTADCMDPAKSTDKFLNALNDKGLANWSGPSLWMRVQDVQVSAFPDGSNYKKNNTRAYWFVLWHIWQARRSTGVWS